MPSSPPRRARRALLLILPLTLAPLRAHAATDPGVTQDIKSAAHDVGHGIVKGAHQLGPALRDTGHAIADGARAAGHAVVSGAHAVGDGLRQVPSTVRGAFHHSSAGG